jgi:DNA polymerase-3 subunit epsilon
MSGLVRPGVLTFDDVPCCILDFETTGFSPQRGDRVVEVGIVRLTAQGKVKTEYSTLINPGRDTGAVYVHDITAKDVVDAPTFREVAGDLIQLMRGAVLVAHNAQYDGDFLAAEVIRAGYPLLNIPILCTLWLSYVLYPEALRHKLGDCCGRDGIEFEEMHNALGDARATSALLLAYFGMGRKRHVLELRKLGCKNLPISETGWPDVAPSGHVLARVPTARAKPPDVPYLAQLVARLDGHHAGMGHDGAAYLELLDHVLQDRSVTENEAEVLVETARRYGLDRSEAMEAHLMYLDHLIHAAMEDGVVSEAERSDLDSVCASLGQSPLILDAMLANRRDAQTASPAE